MSSTPRIGPGGAPVASSETGAVASAHAPGQARVETSGDRLETHDAAKARPVRAEQATTGALTTPLEQPETERRARLGGDRGAWTARVRDGILFAADNPGVGSELLAAFARGVA